MFEAAPAGAPTGAGGYCIRNTTRGTTVSSSAVRARGYWSRLLGLLLRPPLGPGEALVIEPCAAIHTLGMRYSIDVLFVDRRGCVVGICERLAPNRLYAGARGARLTIELPVEAIQASQTQLGDRLKIERS